MSREYMIHRAPSVKIRLCSKTQINAAFTHKTKDKQNATIPKPAPKRRAGL